MAPQCFAAPPLQTSEEVSHKRARTMTSETIPEIAERCVNTIRTLAADVVQKANSGHPGACSGPAFVPPSPRRVRGATGCVH